MRGSVSKNNLIPVESALGIKVVFVSVTRFHPQNVLGIRQFADTLGCMVLVESADKYVQQYFHDVSLCEEYLTLSASELLDIVKRDELHVMSEEQVSRLSTSLQFWIRNVGRLLRGPEVLA